MNIETYSDDYSTLKTFRIQVFKYFVGNRMHTRVEYFNNLYSNRPFTKLDNNLIFKNYRTKNIMFCFGLLKTLNYFLEL